MDFTKLTKEEKSYLFFDSFPLTQSDKEVLLSPYQAAVEAVKNLEKTLSTLPEKTAEKYKPVLNALKDGKAYFDKIVGFLEKENIVPIARCHPYYPKDLQKKPLCFYAKGNVSLLQTDKFVVVGSRNTSTFVSLLTKSVAKDLSNVFTVLTGVAEGGDLSAVEGALNGSKKVICLLPSGFSAVPKQNLSILEQAEKDGLLLTCRPYETTVYPYFYEERNECLADLSKGGLIVSAGEKSGALITAKYLFKTGKPVFAFPYEIGSKYGTGCNKLIQSGAYLTETADDVLTKLGMAPTADVKKPSSYSATEQAVLSALQTESELGIEQLTLLTSLPTPTLIGVLTSLEMKEAILRVGGNKYKLTP